MPVRPRRKPVRSAGGDMLYAASLLLTTVAGGASLEPGAEISDCRSVLRPGPSDCETAKPVPAEPNMPVGDPIGRAPTAEPSEQQIDAFLAAYGKPPREAVRALLEPTDDNVRALLHKQQENLALAAYVASRLTALRAQEAAGGAVEQPIASTFPIDQAALLQMRVTLVQRPQDPDAAPALLALRTLAARVPTLQARIQLVGTFDAARLRAEFSRFPPPLSVSTIAAALVDEQMLPCVSVEDLRSRTVRLLDAHALDAERLREAMLQLRRESSKADGTADALPQTTRQDGMASP